MYRADENLKRKIMMMMAFRMVIIITLLGSAILIQLVSRTILPINPLYFLIFLTSFLTLLYAFGYNRMNNLEVLAYLQLSGDILVITLLIYFTGGVRSSFSFLYILAVVTGSILLYRRGSLYIATISALFYTALALILLYGLIPYYDLSPEEIASVSPRETYYLLFWHMVAFYAIALLGSYLSEGLKRSDTARQEIDEDLSDLKILHEKIIGSMRSGLIIADMEGRINFINEAGQHILNLPVHRVLGQTIQKLYKDEILLDSVKQHLEKSTLLPLERSIRESEKLIGMNICYLHSKKGIPSGFLMIYQDITESRKVQRQFRLQERMIAMGTMAAGIAHEIRNPLAAIRGSVQMLHNEVELSEDQRQLMEIVLTESLRLDQTIQNFLNFAKPKPLDRERNDLKKIVSDMLAFIEKSPEFREGHRILFSKTLEEFEHDFDCDQLKQVIWNLCINALRAMPAGGVLEVSLEHDLYGNTLLSFRDEGKGIEPDRLDSIFDPFQDSTTGGSGLGMAIVYRIVQDHNGQITINSKPGSGTTITVHLPMKSTEILQPLLQ
jgi:two-component system sensor histidine kinase PilS (NtrC family)